MERRVRFPRVTTGVLLAVGFLASAVLFPDLPRTMVTHWNAGGRADGAMGRSVGAFAVPVIAALSVPVLSLAPRFDPDGIDDSSRGTYEWFIAGFVLFLLYVHGVLLAWNLGYDFSFDAVLAVGLAGFLLGCGEFLARIGDNRIGAWGFRTTGVVTLVGGLLVPSLVVPLVLVGTVGTSVWMVVAEDRRSDEPL